jgi:hypothetical protein
MLLSSVATAQPEAPARERHGLTFGLSLGGGAHSASCDSCDAVGTVAVAVRIGWLLSPRFALLYDGSGFGGSPNGFNSSMHLVLAGAGQFWVMPRLWLKAGVGLAQLDVNEGVFGQQEREDQGLGLVGAVGYELMSLGRFELEVEARTTVGFYDEKSVVGAGALLGLSWY